MSQPQHAPDERHALAERIRQALISAAIAAREDAGIRGLCPEGQWEAVVTALRGVDLASIVAAPPQRSSSGE